MIELLQKIASSLDQSKSLLDVSNPLLFDERSFRRLLGGSRAQLSELSDLLEEEKKRCTQEEVDIKKLEEQLEQISLASPEAADVRQFVFAFHDLQNRKGRTKRDANKTAKTS